VNRKDLQPASALPFAYFIAAHAGLAAALLTLAIHPALPGGFFLHPRMVAVVHLVTLAWISGSILGAFYIVAPLALGMPLRVGWMDWLGFGAFAIGVSGMVSHFWMGEYSGMAWSAGLVLVPVAWLAAATWLGAPSARMAWPVAMHIALAFFNMLAAAGLGMWLGVARSHGIAVRGQSPFSMVFAHLHIAAIGWALMMVVGVAYRLLPMILPAKPPAGGALAVSGVLIEIGLWVLVAGFLWDDRWLIPGALVIAAGVGAVVRNVRRMFGHRLPRPPALPARDWSTWQVHASLIWLAVALGLGLWLARHPDAVAHSRPAWVYGVAGLLGGLAQIVTGMQGRLVPLYAYYRAMAARDGAPPERSANALPSERFAGAIFSCWLVGVPSLAWGLSHEAPPWITFGSATLLGGVAIGAWYLGYLARRARTPGSR
jgi:hypothetical protein